MNSIYFDYAFTTLNEYINAERGNRYAGAKLKKRDTAFSYMIVKSMLFSKKVATISNQAHFTFTWYLKNKRSDPDNVAFGKKFILDGMVQAGLLQNDNAKFIKGFEDKFVYGDKQGVLVEWKSLN